MGSCVLKTSVDRVSVDTLSANISTNTGSICRPSVGRHVGRHVVRVNRLLVDTLSICWSTLGRHLGRYVVIDSRWCIGRLSVMYRSIIGGIGVLITDVLLK